MGSNQLILLHNPIDCPKSREHHVISNSLCIFAYVPDSVYFCLLVHSANEDAFIVFFKSRYIGAYGVGFFFFFLPQISRPCPLNGVNIRSHMVFICHDFCLPHSVAAFTRAGATNEFAYRYILAYGAWLVNKSAEASSL